MKIFTKMKHMMLMAAAVLCTNAAFAQDAEYSAVWMNDFEDANTFSDGFKSGNAGRYEILQSTGYKSDSKALEFSYINVSGNNGTTNTFTPNAALKSAFETFKDEYQFDFYYKSNAANNQNGSGINIVFSSGSTVSLLAPKSSDATIVINGGESVGTLPNKTWCHIYIKCKDNVTTISIKNAGDESRIYADNQVVANSADIISLINNVTVRYWGEVFFDDMTLSAPGAKEDISAPSISITEVDGIKRTITINPGVGTVGTPASATYYTTDNSEPSKDNGTAYTVPFEISATSTIKAISYLSDGTDSEVTTFVAEAGTEISLSDEIIHVIGFEENDDVLNPIIGNTYNKSAVFLSPEVELTVTFNGEEVELPYTVTENGTIAATATAKGYISTSEEYTLQAEYAKTDYVDFTQTTKENFTELLGEDWTITAENTRWANWEKTSGDIYNIANCSNNNLTDFLYSQYGHDLMIGYGVGRNPGNDTAPTEFRIANPVAGQIVLFEMNEARQLNTTSWVPYYVMYADDNKLSCNTIGTRVLAKVTVYSPILVVTEGKDLTAAGTYTSATYTRKIEAGKYGTICLPFAPDAASLANYTFFTMKNAEDGVINFVEEKAPVANTPYIYCLKGDNEAITGGVTVVSATLNDVVAGDWTMKGSFTNQAIDATTGNYYGLSSGTIVKANKTLTVKPYRAYFTSEKAAAAVTLRFTRGDETTEITTADLDVQPATVIYDLAGRRVEKMEKGIYIVNGKKVIR